ncbi:MAG: LysE family translocator [Propionicimonas sp.]|uniref:LysE family translocator n=1 Tax=Propionicimonas sp. TaxID=1955623 RepID=UPI003D105CB2
MEQFVAVAAAHFLALLVPGVDFVLIARTSLAHGWRSATGACVGIAVANGVFITAAFTGLSLVSNPVVLTVVQLVGGFFLVLVGTAFLRTRGGLTIDAAPGGTTLSWPRNFALGVTSGLLNPKNALFYLSLAAAVSAAPPLVLAGYGVWMFTVVLVWDVSVAVALGSGRALARLGRVLPALTRVAGGFLVLFGLGMLLELVPRLSSVWSVG